MGGRRRAREWRHSLALALDADECPELAQRLRDCGNYAVPFRCECPSSRDALRVSVRMGCGLRCCPRCSKREARRQVKRWRHVIRSVLEAADQGEPQRGQRRLMLVTLTQPVDRRAVLRQERRSDTEGCVDTREGRRRQRRRPEAWNAHVRDVQRRVRGFLREFYPGTPRRGERRPQGFGGIVVYELGGGLNWHAHALVWGPYIPKAELQARWSKLSEFRSCPSCGFTADPPGHGRRRESVPSSCPTCERTLELRRSYYPEESRRQARVASGVDVRVCTSERKALAYVTKYLTKPSPVRVASVHALATWSLAGTRRVGLWGSLYNWPQDQKPGLGVWCLACRTEPGIDHAPQAALGYRIDAEELERGPPGGWPAYPSLPDWTRAEQERLAA